MPEREPESPLPPDFQGIVEAVNTAAQQSQGDCLQLLALLRLLESLHRGVCDELFQPSLPTNRQALYALLRDIEAEGGWPYIHRMKLQGLLVNLAADIEADEGVEAGEGMEVNATAALEAGADLSTS
jgi:hypothetical protein